jgi:hypothetical protein
MSGKLQELADEFRTVMTGRGNLLDSILPPILFVALNALFTLQVAAIGSLTVAVLLTAVRLIRRQPVQYALGGLGGVGLAVLVAWLVGRAEGYFLPSLVTSAGTLVLMAISLIARRPLVAWTSFLARRWPLEWYWHRKVRPAYGEVTWLWLAVFGARLGLQLVLFQREEPVLLGVANLLGGWPATVILLIISYLYGTWRLQNLGGPSVEEFRSGAEPPWESQQRGF